MIHTRTKMPEHMNGRTMLVGGYLTMFKVSKVVANLKDKIQQQFKVINIVGDQVLVQHMFTSHTAVADKISKLIGCDVEAVLNHTMLYR